MRRRLFASTLPIYDFIMENAGESVQTPGHFGVARQLKAGATWIAAARLVVNGLGLVSSLTMAWLLTPKDFGLVAISIAILTITAEITELSLSSALIQREAPTDQDFSTAFTLNAVRALILGSVLAAISVPVAAVYDDNRLIDIMLVLAAGITCHGLTNPKFVIFLRRLDFRAIFIVHVAQKLGGFIVGVAVATWLRSYWAIVFGMIASQLISVAVSYLLIPFRPWFTFRGAKSLLHFSVWLSLSRVTQAVTFRLDQLFIGYLLGPIKLGAYSYGENLAELVTRELTSPIAQTLFPGFTRIAADKGRLRRAYLRAQGVLVALALPVGFGFALIAHPLVLFALGPKWHSAVIVLQFISAALAIQSFGSAVQPLALALAQTRAIFKWDIYYFFVRVPIVLGGLFLGGLAGAVYARCIAAAFTAAISMTLARRLIGIPLRQQLSGNWRSIVATASMVGLGAAMQSALERGEYSTGSIVASTIAAGASTYVAITAGLWILTGRPEGPETEFTEIIRARGP